MVLFVLIGVVVWLCYVLGWGIFGIIVFGYEWYWWWGLVVFVVFWLFMLLFFLLLFVSKVMVGILWGVKVYVYKIGILL